jgi:phage tail-like protein
MAKRWDPYKNFKFRIKWGGRFVAGFRSVEIGASVVEVVEVREGSEPGAVRKVPGLRKSADVVLKRGVMSSQALLGWFRAVVNGEPNLRRDVVLVQFGDGGKPVASFVIREAWPKKYEPSALNAKNNDIAIETLELVNEGLDLP